MPSRSEHGPLRIGDVFLEKYQVLEVMGRGGYGCVYRAESLFIGREVAIKVLDRPGGLTPEMMARGQREAVALGKLSAHPNIVDVHDAGISPEGHLYIVMELLEGKNLAQRLKDDGPFDVPDGLRLLIALCGALEFAREAKVVHRDLKPANIFLVEGAPPKILDFGVSKIAGSSGFQTAPKMVVGTALYVSPEQVRAQPATHRSDIYALGLVAFQIFKGDHPLLLAAPDTNRRDPRAIWALHVRTPAPRLDTVIAGFPEYLARLVNTALAKEPAQRYPTAAELGRRAQQALTRYENDRAIERGRPLPRPAAVGSRGAEDPQTQPLYGALPSDSVPLSGSPTALEPDLRERSTPPNRLASVVEGPARGTRPDEVLRDAFRRGREPADDLGQWAGGAGWRPGVTKVTVTETRTEPGTERDESPLPPSTPASHTVTGVGGGPNRRFSRLALGVVILAGLLSGVGLAFLSFPQVQPPKSGEKINVGEGPVPAVVEAKAVGPHPPASGPTLRRPEPAIGLAPPRPVSSSPEVPRTPPRRRAKTAGLARASGAAPANSAKITPAGTDSRRTPPSPTEPLASPPTKSAAQPKTEKASESPPIAPTPPDSSGEPASAPEPVGDIPMPSDPWLD